MDAKTWFKDFTLTPAIAVLIIANFVPIIGVFALGWDVATILTLYWLENLVIGALNIPKMLSCKGGFGEKLFITPFFAVHFGGFCFGHGAFLSELFKADLSFWTIISDNAMLIAVASLFISHTVSMLINFYGKGEYKDRSASTQMFIPYGRIVVMHVVILIGGFLAMLFGAPILALLVLIGLKMFMDITAHRIEHGEIDNIFKTA